MNWYKLAQRKTLEELIHEMESDPRVSPDIIAWIRSLPDSQKGHAIATVKRDPGKSIEEIAGKLTKQTTEPLSEEDIRLANYFPSLKEWISSLLLNLKGKKREEVRQLLWNKAPQIRDWQERTRSQMKGRSLEDALERTEKWHQDQLRVESGEYLPTEEKNIVIKYPNGWTWQRVSRGTDAKVEGKIMQHCVGNYCDDIDEGKINVYSLRNEINQPLVTAGFKYENAVVVQMKGSADRNPAVNYSGYIKDIFKLLGTQYNDGESYISEEEFGVKEFSRLTTKDIEKSDLLKKIIINAISKDGDPPLFAREWATNSLNSKNPPQELVSSVNKFIAQTGKAPEFSYDWAKNLLESGKAPQELIDGIMEYILRGNSIRKKGDPPKFAEIWVRVQLENETPTIINVINKFIEFYGFPPEFANNWAKNLLDSGKAPKEWINSIIKYVDDNDMAPTFAYDWAKNLVESKEKSKRVMYKDDATKDSFFQLELMDVSEDWAKISWLDRSDENISNGYAPLNFAEGWAKSVIENGKVPKAWMEGFGKSIRRFGRVPKFAEDFVQTLFLEDKAPQEWIDNLYAWRKEKFQLIPDWLWPWAKKNNLI